MGPGHWWLRHGRRTAARPPRSATRRRQRSTGRRRCRATPKSSASGRSSRSSRRRAASTIDDLAARTGVTTRTIRRDLEALQTAGFPLFDETHDGKKYWTLEQKAFRRLDDTGFTLAELSALYFSRTLVECLSGTPFERDVRSAFDKLSAALTPGMQQFLDRMPLVMQAKAEPGAQATAPRTKEVAQLVEATMQHRRVTMRYHSFSSNREKTYVLEPYRLLFGQGGLYVIGMVPEYGELRTFAVDRIEQISLTEERFEPLELPEDAFAHSLGVNQGTPENDRGGVRAEDRALRPRAGLASVAGGRRRSGRLPPPDAATSSTTGR